MPSTKAHAPPTKPRWGSAQPVASGYLVITLCHLVITSCYLVITPTRWGSAQQPFLHVTWLSPHVTWLSPQLPGYHPMLPGYHHILPGYHYMLPGYHPHQVGSVQLVLIDGLSKKRRAASKEWP